MFLIACSSAFVLYLAVHQLISCSGTREDPAPHPASYHIAGLWNKPLLIWRLQTPPPIPKHLVEKDLLQQIDKSFMEWEHAGIFTFAQSKDQQADITISFAKPPDRAWDGRLGTMGAAFYPWMPMHGHIYLDPAESWRTMPFSMLGDPITDWLPHEIGHILGLPHDLREGYVMHDSGPYDPPSADDFSQLQRLYQPRTINPAHRTNKHSMGSFAQPLDGLEIGDHQDR